MKHIISSILERIQSQEPNPSKQLRVRLSGFEDAVIYEATARALHQRYDRKIKVVTCLSNEKWQEFQARNEDRQNAALQSMRARGWIAENHSLTHYRNLPMQEAQLIVMMGTEAVADQGGLNDCFYLDPLRLEEELGERYHLVFPCRAGKWERDEAACIDRLCKDLFALVPKSLCKLSEQADNWANRWGNLDSAQEFVERFYGDLPFWGLCAQREKLPSVSKIASPSAKKNFLQKNFDFIKRKAFQKMSQKKYLEYLDKIEQYRTEDGAEYTDEWPLWDKQSLPSYDKYAAALRRYISGQDIEETRGLLTGVEFSVTDAVLNLKIPKPTPTPKPKEQAIYGPPLTAFAQAVLTTLCAEENCPFDELRLVVKSVELADAVNPLVPLDESAQLAEGWRRVCWHTGGIAEYLSRWGFEYGGQGVSITLAHDDGVDVFDPQCARLNVNKGLICVASASKKLDKLTFEIQKRFQGKLLRPREKPDTYEWRFTLRDNWAVAFSPLSGLYAQWKEREFDSFVPLFTTERFSDLMEAKSEEEFLDILDESAISGELDLTSYFRKKRDSSGTAKEWIARFSELGRCFMDFCASLFSRGFYADLNAMGDSKTVKLVDAYIGLGEEILRGGMTREAEWVFEAFIYAFAIEKDDYFIRAFENPAACILTPFHPAILEKLHDQTIFLLDGCKEWERNRAGTSPSFEQVRKAVQELAGLSQIREGVDVFPEKRRAYFGVRRAYANYCLYGREASDGNAWMKSILQKEAVFDDNFKDSVFKEMNPAAEMIGDVIAAYIRALPNAADNLSLAFINPNDFQPVIAAVYQHIQEQKGKSADESRRVQILLNILVPPEDKGGRNYLSYWANTAFTQDENVDVRIYLNAWSTRDDLQKLLPSNLDFIFLMDVLKRDSLRFIQDRSKGQGGIGECRFPIVYKPSPVIEGAKRRIELTQPQFQAATVHSQAVYYRDDYEMHPEYQRKLVIREVSIDQDRQELISALHRKANWVICADSGMDGALLRNNAGNEFDIIGFSTGRGPHGQYNVTITARKSIIYAVEERLKARLRQLFHWNPAMIRNAASLCMEQARKLDGVSLFSAINPNDQNIRAFLAYLLSSLQMPDSENENALRTLIHLDSYRHWFSKNALEQDYDNALMPDFLLIRAEIGESGKLILHASVIECKIALYDDAYQIREKAFQQIRAGIERLSEIFNPRSQSVRRRYWFAQLYRALAFSQITFYSDTAAHQEIAAAMRHILEGEFEIQWFGKSMCYWLDMPGDKEIVSVEPGEPPIELHEIPQKKIQRLLLQNPSADVAFVRNSDMETETDFPGDNFPDTAERDAEQPQSSDTPERDAKEPQSPDTAERDAKQPQSSDTERTSPQKPSSELFRNSDAEGKPLSQIRVLIGKERNGNEVFWDFGHPQLPNRHVLITGTSGQGKTYSIQVMLKALSENGVSSVIFDYTEGFRKDQLEKPFQTALGERIQERIIYATGVPINPFRRHEIEISGVKMREKISDVSQRIANIFAHVYDFKEQQFSAIYEACRMGIEQYGDAMSMDNFKEKLSEVKNPAAKTVLSKMAPFLDSVEFAGNAEFDWGSVTQSHGTVTIFQLTNFVREVQVIITELMLWDAWHYNKKYGDKTKPFVVVLDEAQNLSHKADSPSAMILTEGRKFGWSAWFATQSLKVLSDDEIVRLQQASFKLYFKPTDDELPRVARQLDSTASVGGALRLLRKGQAIVAGDRLRPDGSFGYVRPVITNIASFEKRESYGGELERIFGTAPK